MTAPVAAAATGRSRPQVYRAIEQLETAGVLIPARRPGPTGLGTSDGGKRLTTARFRGWPPRPFRPAAFAARI